MFNHLAADWTPLVWNGRRGDHLRIALQHFFEVAGNGCLWILFPQILEPGGILIVDHGQLATSLHQTIDLSVDVSVVEVGRGKLEIAGANDFLNLGRHRRVGHAVFCVAHRAS